MSEQQTPEEIADDICRWNNPGLRNLVVEAIRNAQAAATRAAYEDAAMICEQQADYWPVEYSRAIGAQDCARAIRARAEAKP